MSQENPFDKYPKSWLRKAYDDEVRELLNYDIKPKAKQKELDHTIKGWEDGEVNLEKYQAGMYAYFSKKDIDVIIKGVAKRIKEKVKLQEKGKKKEDKEAAKQMKQQGENNYDFILNSEEVWKDKLFVFGSLNKDVAYFGLLLPKSKDVYDKNNNFLFKRQIKAPAIITSDKRLIPVNHQLHEEYKINLKESPSEMKTRWELESIKKYLDGKEERKSFKEIFEKIKGQYDLYLSMEDVWKKIHSLWDIGTYFFPLFNIYPIFELRGLAGTGKTKAMALSSQITFNSSGIMINPSEATLFRETDIKRPTKYIDEAESLFRIVNGKPEADLRVEVINSSYRYDGFVPRQEKIDGCFVTKYYHTYSPTMVGSINGLFGATENRAIIRITTKPKEKDKSKGDSEPNPNNKIWQEIRNSLYISSLDNWKKIKSIYENHNNTTGLKNRDYWLWKPLLILAKEISDELYEEVLERAKKQQDIKEADYISEDSIDYSILKILYDLIKESNIAYIKIIHQRLPDSQYKPKERTISNKLDKLGFRDYRNKDRNGSYFGVSKEVFEGIITPICPSIFSEKSSQSSQSSQNNEYIEDKQEELIVTNGDECDETKNRHNRHKIKKVSRLYVTNVTKKPQFQRKKEEIKKHLFKLLETNKEVNIQDFTDNMIKLLGTTEIDVENVLKQLKEAREVFEARAGYLRKLE